MHISPLLSRSLTSILSFLLVTAAYSQARYAADRRAQVDVFAGVSEINSDYQGRRDFNTGVTFGVDYTHFTRYFHNRIVPSLEVRGTFLPGDKASEKTLETGLKLAASLGRIHPYGDFLIGAGSIDFPLPPNPIPGVDYYTHDNSFLYIYGGGLTYDVTRDFSVMLDYTHQYWDLGEQPPNRFYPQGGTVGVVYHIPFGHGQ